jgi:hypothetical protein
MDEADRAQQTIELELNHALAAARLRGHARRSAHCLECGDPLPALRQQYGRCVECQRDLELKERRYAGQG